MMGTFYEFRGDIFFDENKLITWLDSKVMPVFPWTLKECSIRDLANALQEGGKETNGQTINPLSIEIGAERVAWTWSWRSVPSEIGPEVRAAAEILWHSSYLFARSGVVGYRDACGPPLMWDFAEILHDGRMIDIARSMDSLSSCMKYETEDDSDDIPF